MKTKTFPSWNWRKPNFQKLLVAVLFPVDTTERVAIKCQSKSYNGVLVLAMPRRWPRVLWQENPSLVAQQQGLSICLLGVALLDRVSPSHSNEVQKLARRHKRSGRLQILEDCNIGVLVGDVISCKDNTTLVYPVSFSEFAVLDMAQLKETSEVNGPFVLDCPLPNVLIFSNRVAVPALQLNQLVPLTRP